ncbi:MAG: DegV family EDD domain-containing protein [Lachnospiraceae bacterium]|nr:DegV family EDD domain-containing protein [Lachnospiraceae bacterium]
MKTAVMTDTNSGISVEAGKADGIYVLPMPVIIDNKDYLEGENVTHGDLYDAMNKGLDVCTSQPSLGILEDMWKNILADGYDEIIYIPMSSALSSSCESALGYAQKYESKVYVADNHRISVSLMESVYDAKAMADSGMSARKIKEQLEKNAYDASIYITVNSLEYLKKSGRVTAAGAAVATVINLKPILTIQGEKLDAFAKIRGMIKARLKMIDALAHDLSTRFINIPKEKLQLATAGTFQSDEEAESWRIQVKEAFPDYPEPYYYPLSCSIACHTGVDTCGIGVIVLDR